jgi:hypothetical protein
MVKLIKEFNMFNVSVNYMRHFFFNSIKYIC